MGKRRPQATGYNETTPASAQVVITRKDVTITPDAGQSKTYGYADPTEYAYSADGLVGDEKLTGTLQREMRDDAGTYAFSLGTLTDKKNANYHIILATGDDVPKFTINPRPVEITWSKSDLTYKIDDSGSEIMQSVIPTVSNKIGNDSFTFAYQTDEGFTNEASTVGDYTAEVTGLGNSNYTLGS